MPQRAGSFAAPLVQEPLHTSYRQLKESLLARLIVPATRYISSTNLYWETVLGLLVGSKQSYAAALFLVSDERGVDGSPGPFPGQAATLARSGVEVLGNLLAVLEAPHDRARLFAIDHYRATRLRSKELRDAYPHSQAWIEWADAQDTAVALWVKPLGLSVGDVTDPSRLPSWPNPYALLDAKERLTAHTGRRPFLSGSALDVYQRLMFDWYPDLSRTAHYKSGGVAMALARALPGGPDPKDLRNLSVIAAVIFHTCVVTEICSARTWGPGPESLLRTWSDSADYVYRIRYEGLLST